MSFAGDLRRVDLTHDPHVGRPVGRRDESRKTGSFSIRHEFTVPKTDERPFADGARHEPFRQFLAHTSEALGR